MTQHPEKKNNNPWQQQIKERITKGHPIRVQLSGKSGDRLILWGSLPALFEEFCSQNGIDSSKLQFDTVTSGQSRDLGLEDIRTVQEPRIRNWPLISQIQYKTGLLLGLTEQQIRQHVDKAPIVSKIPGKEGGPLKDYDEELVTKNAKEIKNQLGNKQIIVVVQTGSREHNRLNNEQATTIAQTLQEKNKDAAVIVVSDQKVESLSKKDKTKISTQSVVSPTSINEFSAWYRAADVVITTDSFGAWLAAGQQGAKSKDHRLNPDNFLVQYSDSDVARFEIPGTSRVAAEAVPPGSRGGVISSAQYEDYWKNVGVTVPPVGLSDADFDELLRAIQ